MNEGDVDTEFPEFGIMDCSVNSLVPQGVLVDDVGVGGELDGDRIEASLAKLVCYE